MKSLSIGLIILTFVSSCANRQFVTVTSGVPREQGRGLVAKTDSVEVSYRFRGEGGSIQIDILNKTKRPLYVDWSKSALIMHGKACAYWQNNYTVSGKSHSYPVVVFRNSEIEKQRIQGQISGMSMTDIIPPNSTLSKTPVKLVNGSIRQSMSKTFMRQGHAKMESLSDQNKEKVFRRRYDSTNSPVQFRSYLTLSNTNDFETTGTFDHSFWVSSIVLGRKTLSAKIEDSETTFHVRSKRNPGIPIAVTILLGVLVAVTL
jgi:hypothetical protein